MYKGRILVVEDDIDISNMLKIYFAGYGYEVDIANRGMDAVEKAWHQLPDLIIEDIMLPDIDGFEVCRLLRANYLTAKIPLIFLTQKDERSDRLLGMESGADIYMSKPFDIEELRLRVKNLIQRRQSLLGLTSPTGLPSGMLIVDHLRALFEKPEGWALLDIRTLSFNAFRDSYGYFAAEDVLRFTAQVLKEEVLEGRNFFSKNFIGHVHDDHFIVCVPVEQALDLKRRLKERFEEEILSHYNFMDRMQGYLINPGTTDERSPLMKLAIGIARPAGDGAANIRVLAMQAGISRREDANA